MDQMDLSDFFTTKSQATDFSARLSTIEGSLYEVDRNLETVLQEQLGVKKKDKFLTLLRENNVALDSNPAIKEFFNKIKESIKSMPGAAITMAVEPDEKILKAISDWFLLNLEQQILIETIVDPELIAGAAVDYKGKHFDASIKSVFKQICAEKLSTQKDSPQEQKNTRPKAKNQINNSP